jgi:formamidase
MPKTIVEIDLKQSPYKNPMIHNRWHPDVPIIAWVKPGDDFVMQTYDWTGGFIKNDESADDVRDIDLTIVHFLSGPIGVEGAEPGDLLVVDLLDVGALPDSLWGFNGFFSKKNGGGFLTDHFPFAQKSIWDISGLYTHSRHVPGVSFAGLIHPGLIGCLPDQKLLDTWNKRETEFIATDPNRVPPLAVPPFAATAHAGSAKGDVRDKIAAEGARTVPPREHGGNCDIKDLSRGSKIYFPVYVKGAGLSMGDLHFSQGDGEITFCGAIEMAGWLHLKVDIIKGGMAKYQESDLQAVADHADLQRLPHLRGNFRRRVGQAALPRCPRRLSPGLPQRDRVPDEVRLLEGAGLRDPRHGPGTGPHIRRGRHTERLRDAVAADRHLRVRRDAERVRTDQAHHGRRRHPDVA